MFLRLLIFLCQVSPFARRAIWRWWYNKLARRFDQDSWTFMNYGYSPIGAEPRRELQAGDEEDRLCIQLYERVLRSTDLAGKKILEVGSGRGGGASFIARYYEPAAVVGVDYSPTAVAFCRKRLQAAGLEFMTGDAEGLPFEGGSFDVVVNVESSHCYGDLERFFREAARVLKPGGWFLYADFREAPDIPKLEGALKAVGGLALEESEDITSRVLAAMEEDDGRKRRLISEFVPDGMRGMFEEFAGVSGAQVNESFKSRRMIYKRYRLKRR